MTNTPEERSMARSIQRGIPIMFIVAGVFALRSKAVPGSPPADFFAGLIAIAFAGALFLKLRWARWLALGACFLAIVGACALPALLFLRDPLRPFVDPSSSTAFSNALLSLFGFAFGGLGYKGLKYYRSDLGRVEHASRSLRPENIAPDRSISVLLSSIVWIVLIAVGWKAGITAPKWLFDSRPEQAQQRKAFEQPATSNFPLAETSDTPVASDADTAAMPAGDDLPDLVPLALCVRLVLEGADAVPNIELAYANRGRSLRANFRYSSSEDGKGRMTPRDSRIPVPSPGSLAFADFMRDADMLPNPGTGASIFVALDPDDSIVERDETNNSITFEVHRDRDHRIDLPNCNLLRLQIDSRP